VKYLFCCTYVVPNEKADPKGSAVICAPGGT
jgi:hypothetical protein